jgi:hypothetical protein
MIKDPIVEEVRKMRDNFAQQFNYDLDSICNDLRQKQAQDTRGVVSLPPKPVIPITTIETGLKPVSPEKNLG